MAAWKSCSSPVPARLRDERSDPPARPTSLPALPHRSATAPCPTAAHAAVRSRLSGRQQRPAHPPAADPAVRRPHTQFFQHPRALWWTLTRFRAYRQDQVGCNTDPIMANQHPPSDLKSLIEDITTDCYNEDEELMGF